jgi:hypothetical protein
MSLNSQLAQYVQPISRWDAFLAGVANELGRPVATGHIRHLRHCFAVRMTAEESAAYLNTVTCD